MNKILQYFYNRKLQKIHANLSQSDFISSHIVFPYFTQGHKGFRIPALISLPNNVLCAFAEGRINSLSDYAHMNLVMKRSEDGGKSWGDLQILMRNEDGLQIHNPCPIFDKNTQELILLVTKNRKTPYLLKSKDFGKTWSSPKVIENINPHGWTFNGPSPGHGIQLDSGRLVVSGMYNLEEPNVDKSWGTYFFYSDDHGETWQLGHDFALGANECLSAALGNDRIFMIARPNKRDEKFKLTAYSEDGGITATKQEYNYDLPSPICQSSIVGCDTEDHTRKLVYSGPILDRRAQLTVRISDDEGKSFPHTRLIYEKYSGYSDLTIMNDGTVGILFECGSGVMLEAIAFARFKL